MQLTKDTKSNLLGNSVVSIPNSLCATKIFAKASDAQVRKENDTLISILWNNQHPLIHTWLLLSSVSICLLFTVFFVIQ